MAAGIISDLVRRRLAGPRAHGGWAAQAWWLADSAVTVNDWPWTLVIDEVSEQLHLRRRIAVRISHEVLMPLACGVWRAVILLPAESRKVDG